MIYHNYLAVIGRVHGNNEDDVLLYQHRTIEEAREQFKADQRGTRADGSCADPIPDDMIYVSYILSSESPIIIEEQNV